MQQEVSRAAGRHDHLQSRAAQYVEELAEEEKDRVPRLVEDQIDAVEKSQSGRGAEEVKPLGEDLPAENRQDEKSQRPPRYRGEGDGVRATLRPSPQASQPGPGRRGRRWRKRLRSPPCGWRGR